MTSWIQRGTTTGGTAAAAAPAASGERALGRLLALLGRDVLLRRLGVGL